MSWISDLIVLKFTSNDDLQQVQGMGMHCAQLHHSRSGAATLAPAHAGQRLKGVHPAVSWRITKPACQRRTFAPPRAAPETTSEAVQSSSAADAAGDTESGSESALDVSHSNGTVSSEDAAGVSALSKAVSKEPSADDIGSESATSETSESGSEAAAVSSSASGSHSSSASEGEADEPVSGLAKAIRSLAESLSGATQSVKERLQPRSGGSAAEEAPVDTHAAPAPAKAAAKEGELALSVHKSIDEVRAPCHHPCPGPCGHLCHHIDGGALSIIKSIAHFAQ